MGEFSRVIVGIIIVLGVFFGSNVKAADYIFMDFDNTIVETRKIYGGSFQSHFILYKINVTNPYQTQPTGPESVRVTQEELRQIFDGLAKNIHGKEVPGTLKTFKLKNGERIVIGDYILVPERSHIEFREGKDRNYLLEAFLEAERSDPLKGWKGAMWEVMVQLLSDPVKAQQFGIITSRGHSRLEWEEFFQYLRSRGYIKHMPNINQIFALSRYEYKNFGNSPDEKKANLLAHLSQYSLGKLPLKSSEASHNLVYAEDSQESLKNVFDEISKVATLRTTQYPMRFYLVNTGIKSHQKKSGFGTLSEVLATGESKSVKLEQFSSEVLSSLKLIRSLEIRERQNYSSQVCVGLFL